jgi:hypothetical protein
MNTDTQIENAYADYLKILRLGQQDVLTSLKSGNSKDFYAALERHKVLTESVSSGIDSLNFYSTSHDGDELHE